MKAEADVIFFAGGAVGSGAILRELAWELEQHGVQVIVAPSVTDVSSERVRVRPVGGLPLMHIDPPTLGQRDPARQAPLRHRRSRRCCCVLGCPLLLASAIAIKIARPWPDPVPPDAGSAATATSSPA